MGGPTWAKHILKSMRIRSYLKPSLDPTQEICFWETSSFYLNTIWSSSIRIFPTRENCHRHRCANLDQRNPALFDILIFWSFFQTPSDHWGFQPCNSPTQKFQFFQIVTKIYWNPGKKNVLVGFPVKRKKEIGSFWGLVSFHILRLVILFGTH